MSNLLPNRYFYKLCSVSNNKFYCCSHQGTSLSIFSTITQDISNPETCIYVYNTPECAFTKEKQITSFRKRSQKLTVVKVMGTGEFKGDLQRRAYATMTVLADVGIGQRTKDSTERSESLNRTTKQKSPLGRGRVAPAMLVPLRIYGSTVRTKSPSSRVKSRNISNVRTGRTFFDTVYQKYQKIKEETKWLTGQVEYLENMNLFNKLEDLESLRSSEG